MAFETLQTAEIIIKLESFVDKHKPPKEIRHEVDLAYKIENQSVILFELREHWEEKGKKIESFVAKTTWVHTQQCWKIFWRRADGKWHRYDPVPSVKTIEQFLQIVDEDKLHCFWG